MHLKVTVNEKAGFINEKGNWLIKPQFEGVGDFSEGFAGVVKDGLEGYIDEAGKFVIKPKFEWAGEFRNGRAFVKSKGLYGLIDKRGRWICKPKFKEVWRFCDDLARVQETWTSPFGYIGLDGKYVIKPRFLFANDFSEGLAAVGEPWGDKSYGMGFIGVNGEYAIKLQYGYAADFSEGLAAVGKTSRSPRCGFINSKDEIVLPHKFSGARLRFSEGLCDVYCKTGWGFINRAGDGVIKPHFHLVQPFSEGLAVASIKPPRKQFKTGFINHDGDWAIEPRFLTVDLGYPRGFRRGIAHVTPDGNRWGYINKAGEYIWEPTA